LRRGKGIIIRFNFLKTNLPRCGRHNFKNEINFAAVHLDFRHIRQRLARLALFAVKQTPTFAATFDCSKHFKMKKLLLLLPVLALIMAACSNEFEVAAPWKEIPVAYAILSPQDSAHYIRVEKAFLDPETSALEIAQIADSLYYPENAIAVFLQRVKTGERHQLYRVDGALEGYPREDGIFATQPNWLYKIKSADLGGLQEEETYRLVIEHTDGKPPVTAQTTVPRDFTLIRPSENASPPRINFFPNSNTDVEWRCDSNAVLFNVYFTIRFREEKTDGSVEQKTLFWKATDIVELSSLSGNNFFRGISRVPGLDFYKFMNENVAPSDGVLRYFDRADVTIVGGGKEIKEFLVSASANSGLTGAEVIPSYSNLSEGFGIFTAKNSTTLGQVLIETKTVDSMNIHPLTVNLNFRY
jgi:hypothetical protein